MIIHSETRERYVIVDKSTIEDDRLSFGARGILAFLLSKPPGWEVYTAYLVKSSPQGKDFIDARLRELEDFGYICRSPRRKSDGTWDGTDVHVYETPQRENPVTDEGPGRGWSKPFWVADSTCMELNVNTAAGGFSRSGGDLGKQDITTGPAAEGLTGAGFSAQREDLFQLKTETSEERAPAAPSADALDADFSEAKNGKGAEKARGAKKKPDPLAEAKATDDPAVAEAHRLTKIAYEQTPKPACRGGFAGVLKIITAVVESGEQSYLIEDALRAGVGVWSIAGLQTAIAKRPKGASNNGRIPEPKYSDQFTPLRYNPADDAL